ncbi:hypothetical protein [Bradyrhizobium elkanii]|uniref:hypothetical protein n=1 Tax=Bradyrhizobium elkanii TaxID=29448 RepID=UPI00209DB115|nr:hypothetical protein [Bradyrhizobium elkanii]MCP1931796.1 hypothetical protein [Bradyrhizobium elkanii]
MLTSQEFFETIVVPNNEAQHADTSSVRFAFNAIAAIDDYVGIWAHELRSAGRISITEECFRDDLARRSGPYRALRDMAFALKHGELSGKKARLVSRAGSLADQGAAFDPDTFSDAFATSGVICIEMDAGGAVEVWKMIEFAMEAITDLQNEVALVTPAGDAGADR